MNAWQLERLRETIEHARRAPFWSRHLEHVTAPSSYDALRTLPIVDKARLRSVPDRDRLTGDESAASRAIRTSGTTGEPFAVYYGDRGAWYQGLLRLRATAERHVGVTQRWVSIDVFEDERRRSRLSPFRRRQRLRVVPADIAGSARRLAALHPQVVAGPAHLLIDIADALGPNPLPVRAVLTNGETLTPESRRGLRERYGVDPLDAYGTSECGLVAWQCKAGDLYHVNHDAVIVEIVDDGGDHCPPGREGELVLTGLWNGLTPFIRYRIGDSAAWATRPCRCGHRQPALTHIAGRNPDWVIDAQGARVSPSRLWLSVHLGVDALPRLRRYRITQDRDRRVRVEIVSSEGFEEKDLRALEAAYREVLGDVGVDVQLVDDIRTDGGRKFETISSEAARAIATRGA
jgi:phenylacetate-coenzyme A ligase PaaK-like adenylate-forming protein